MSAEIGLGVTAFKLSNLQKEIRSGNSHHISTFKFLKEKKLLRVHFSQLSSITSNGLAAETTIIQVRDSNSILAQMWPQK